MNYGPKSWELNSRNFKEKKKKTLKIIFATLEKAK